MSLASRARTDRDGAGGESTPGSDPAERITRLFPKCRPRHAMHHHDRLNSGLDSRSNDINNINNASSDEERDKREDHSRSNAYKLRDSRIIEIAGGRELYSQSRSKAVRKLRHSSQTHKHNLRNKARLINRDAAEYADTFNSETPVQRLINTDVPKRMLSKTTSPTFNVNGERPRLDPYLHRDLDLHKELDIHRDADNREIDLARDLMTDRESSRNLLRERELQQKETSPGGRALPAEQKGSPIAVVADGEVVVFEDINDHWKGLRLDNETSDAEPDVRRPEAKNGCDAFNMNALNSPDGNVVSRNHVDGNVLSRNHADGNVLSRNHADGNVISRNVAECNIVSRNVADTNVISRNFADGNNTSRNIIDGNAFTRNIVDGNILSRNNIDSNILTRSVADISASEASCDGGSEASHDVSDDERRVRVIGELPIAEYEGSPRRYGVGSLTANKSPRPGFPQRVVSEALLDGSPPSPPTTAFDYLYEFSETRKVLEEFFKCPAGSGIASSTHMDLLNFQDLDYELRRQQECNGSGRDPDLVDLLDQGTLSTQGIQTTQGIPSTQSIQTTQSAQGIHSSQGIQSTQGIHSAQSNQSIQTIQGIQSTQGTHWETRAPSPQHNHTNFLGLQGRDRHKSPAAALSLGGAWSGSGSARLSASPSPSTDSRADSDLSLLLMESELNELKVLSESRCCVGTLPLVEDGLSSGHASDNDNNNQQMRSSVLIQEIVENGTVSDHLRLSNTDLHSLDPLGACSEGDADGEGDAEGEAACERDGRGSEARRSGSERDGASDEPPPPAPALPPPAPLDPIYVARKRQTSAQSTESLEIKQNSADEEEADTDLETDRLLGQQRTDDQGFYDDKGWRKPKSRTVMPAPTRSPPAPRDADHEDAPATIKDKDTKKKGKNKEGLSTAVLIEGVLFRARYLGSTQLACEGQPTKATRMLQAEEAVNRIKAPEGENQPSTEVDLFISTEKIMVLNTELKEIMMDHALRTISYIADIGELVVLMARRRFVPHDSEPDPPKLNRTPKMICHVFESEEAQFIAQSIGQAFQVAYMEFLKANGIEDHGFVKEMDYQEVLNSQEIFGDELQMFAKKELQKEVVVPKSKGEILGVVVVESGWGSMLPTVVIANLAPAGAAARCGHLNIGDQIIAINGVSLVGLPLSTCQSYIKGSKAQTVVKLTVVPCPPVVEVKIKRPDTKYQLGFSVQNGVICSLLRGGIAERGGVRVGHRIIEINSQSVVAVPHERIVNLLATSVGEILMKTMPTSMFRLLTGQENPVFI